MCTVLGTHLPGRTRAAHPDRLPRALQVIHACPAAHGGGGPRGPDPPGALHNAVPEPAAAAAAAGPLERGPSRAEGTGWPQPLGAQHQVLRRLLRSLMSPNMHWDRVAELGVLSCLLRSFTSPYMNSDQVAELMCAEGRLRNLKSPYMHGDEVAEPGDLMSRWIAAQAASICNLYPAASHLLLGSYS